MESGFCAPGKLHKSVAGGCNNCRAAHGPVHIATDSSAPKAAAEKYHKILVLATLTMVFIFNINALIAYFTFKASMESILTETFAINGFTTFMTVCVCFNALISYPVQALCAFDIME